MLKLVSWIGYWILQAQTPLWALGTSGFFLKNSQGFEIWKAAVFCHHVGLVERACFSTSLYFSHNVCTRAKRAQWNSPLPEQRDFAGVLHGHKWPKAEQEDKQTRANDFTNSWAGGNEISNSSCELSRMTYHVLQLLSIYTEILLFFLRLCRVRQPRPGAAQHHIPHAAFYWLSAHGCKASAFPCTCPKNSNVFTETGSFAKPFCLWRAECHPEHLPREAEQIGPVLALPNLTWFLIRCTQGLWAFPCTVSYTASYTRCTCEKTA